MEFSYPIGLRLVNPAPEIDFRLEPYRSIVQDAIVQYNRHLSSFNPKRIEEEPLYLGQSELAILLKSSVELNVPGRAIRSLSQTIAHHPAFSSAVPNGRLFKTFPVSTPNEDSKEVVLSDSVEDAEFMCALITYFMKKADSSSTVYRKKRKAIAQMKVLAIESGILSPKGEKTSEGEG